MFLKCLAIACLGVFLPGCMHISAKRLERDSADSSYKPVSGGGFNRNNGFEMPRAQPYLMVANTGKKDEPSRIEIIYLPDYDHITTFDIAGLFGSAELGFTMQNGLVATLNSKQDSKTPETIGAIGTAAGSALTGLGTVVAPLAAGGTDIIKALISQWASLASGSGAPSGVRAFIGGEVADPLRMLEAQTPASLKREELIAAWQALYAAGASMQDVAERAIPNQTLKADLLKLVTRATVLRDELPSVSPFNPQEVFSFQQQVLGLNNSFEEKTKAAFSGDIQRNLALQLLSETARVLTPLTPVQNPATPIFELYKITNSGLVPIKLMDTPKSSSEVADGVEPTREGVTTDNQ